MKKDRHILINLTDGEYKSIQEQANQQERTITNYCYLVIKKHLQERKH